MNKKRIAFILEGESREKKLFENIKREFFPDGGDFDIITLAAGQNIYMLSKRLERDDGETDVLEVLKEYSNAAAEQLKGLERNDFQEIYLFFDYDVHSNNLPLGVDMHAALEGMLKTFDNETENGKLYISYPMIEAIRHIPQSSEGCYRNCVIGADAANYKGVSAQNLRYAQMNRFNQEKWKEVIQYTGGRLECILWKKCRELTFQRYRHEVSQAVIYQKQYEEFVKRQNKIFVLSAVPLFLLDYFRENFWNDYMTN